MQRELMRLHFVGIGGIGMAGLAELLHAQGWTISGSDVATSPTTERLESLGIAIARGHDADLVGDAQTVVRSSAIPSDNVEIVAAQAREIPIVDRGALLAELMENREGIAIGGSHGKTTTSAMVSHLFEVAGRDPTALIGGRVPRPDGQPSPTRLGKSDLFVAEVDESDGSFLLTRPFIAVLTNADPEHLDYYGTREALFDAFVDFANSVPDHGAAILGIDHPGIAEITPRISVRQVRFGFDASADIRGLEVATVDGGQRCRASIQGGDPFEFTIPLPGAHNVLNALAAIATGVELGVPPAISIEALANFPGVARRFERKGAASGIEFVDDYAHHPTEILATLRAARSLHAGRIVAIFQPHRYTRTRDCWNEFLGCFEEADRVIVSDIYPASEVPIPGIDSASLVAEIAKAGHGDARFGGSLDAIAQDAAADLAPGDLVLTLGAGSVVGLGPRLLEAIGENDGGGA